MVKLRSTIGLKLKGKHGNFIFQDVNGDQVLRQGYKEKKEPTPQQLEVRERFKLAVSWAKNLSTAEKRYIRQYYKELYPSWVPGQPSTWYNFAKSFVLTVLKFELVNAEQRTYLIEHPGIVSVYQYDSNNILIQSIENLTILSDLKFKNKLVITALNSTTTIIITTLGGASYTFNINPAITELIYCDINYCNPNYCK